MRFTSQINGYTALALTKIDILDKLDEIKIGVNYIKNGQVMDHYPSNIYQYDGVTVEYVTMPGWKTSISSIRKFEDLPANAQNYITKVEKLLGVPFRWVGVGPERDSMILRN